MMLACGISRMLCLLTVITLSSYLQNTLAGIYLPGVSPHVYQRSEQVKLFVSKVSSTKTQVPYEYYSLPYCKPKTANFEKENIGEVISGDRIENSVYKIEAKVPKSCEVACVVKLRKADKDSFAEPLMMIIVFIGSLTISQLVFMLRMNYVKVFSQEDFLLFQGWIWQTHETLFIQSHSYYHPIPR